MGLAASQGRMLCLTARKNDLIYEGQQISQQRLALADQQQLLAENYTDKMNNTIMKAHTMDGEERLLTFDVLTSTDIETGLGMRIVDSNGNVVVPNFSDYIEVEKDGNKTKYNDLNKADFVNTYLSSIPDMTNDDLMKKSFTELKKIFDDNNLSNVFGNSTVSNHQYDNLKTDKERFCFDDKVTDPEYLQKMLTSGEWTLEKYNPMKDLENADDSKFESFVWQASTSVSEVMDTSDDRAAEAEYESEMLALQKRDKLLELRLEEVQTQEQAVEKDLDSVKSVIDKNVEDSFKTFA